MGEGGDVAGRDWILLDALQELRRVASDLRAYATEPRDGYLDPGRLLDAYQRIERISGEIQRALGAVDDPPAPAGPVRSFLDRPRVLVVDDDEATRELATTILAPSFDVITAADGEEALRVARAEHPAVILMDLYMPRLDGLGALELLRADPALESIPVIVVSASATEAARVRALDLGAVDFLAKPFSEHELRARLARTLRLVRSQTVLRELAETDPLTGLANLRAFRSRLDVEVKRALRYRTPLTCVMADMDHLKAINDQLGHAAGDLAIGGVAHGIAEELRETDFGARYGGDEFVLLLPHTSREDGRILAERICARLRQSPLSVGSRRILLAVSFGVAELSMAGDGDRAGELVRAADAALYDAKHAGRGRVAVAEKLA
jgi:diguanylate cyclase (GGDEF)-like protein